MLAESVGQVQRPSWLLPPDPDAGAARVQQRGSQVYSARKDGPVAFFDASESESVAERRRERSKFSDPSNGIRVPQLSLDSHGSQSEQQDSSRSFGLWQQAKSGNLPTRVEHLATVPAEMPQSSPPVHHSEINAYSAPQITSDSWTSPRADRTYAVDSTPRAISEYQSPLDKPVDPTEDQRRLIMGLKSEVHVRNSPGRNRTETKPRSRSQNIRATPRSP